MIREAERESGTPNLMGFANADVEHIPLADNSVDCVILWRLLHHIRDRRIRQAMLREAARVTRDKVIVSFHHPFSLTAVRKEIEALLSPSKRRPGTISHWRLRQEAQACGLQMTQTRSFRRYISINWFACLKKRV